MAQWNSSFSNFDRIEQLSIHFYDNAIEKRKEERKMKGTMLVGVKEQQLHSMQDYLNALNIVFDYNKEIGHLDGNVAPIVADWPGQRYIRQALTHFYNKNENSIPKEIVLFVPLLGPLYVAFNTKEQVMKIYYLFFEKLFHFVFGERKVLAKKPRP